MIRHRPGALPAGGGTTACDVGHGTPDGPGVASAAVTRTFDPYAPQADDRYEAMAAVRADEKVVETPAGWYVATAAGVLTGLREVEKFVGSFVDTASNSKPKPRKFR